MYDADQGGHLGDFDGFSSMGGFLKSQSQWTMWDIYSHQANEMLLVRVAVICSSAICCDS